MQAASPRAPGNSSQVLVAIQHTVSIYIRSLSLSLALSLSFYLSISLVPFRSSANWLRSVLLSILSFARPNWRLLIVELVLAVEAVLVVAVLR